MVVTIMQIHNQINMHHLCDRFEKDFVKMFCLVCVYRPICVWDVLYAMGYRIRLWDNIMSHTRMAVPYEYMHDCVATYYSEWYVLHTLPEILLILN